MPSSNSPPPTTYTLDCEEPPCHRRSLHSASHDYTTDWNAMTADSAGSGRAPTTAEADAAAVRRDIAEADSSVSWSS